MISLSKFKFRYEKILNFLEKQEKDIQNKLSKAQNELLKEEKELTVLIKKDNNYNNVIREELNNGCTLNFIKNLNNYKNNLSNLIDNQNIRINSIQRNIKDIRYELIDVAKDKKIMEKLREKKKLEHHNTLLSIEEKMIDELVTYSNSLVRR